MYSRRGLGRFFPSKALYFAGVELCFANIKLKMMNFYPLYSTLGLVVIPEEVLTFVLNCDKLNYTRGGVGFIFGTGFVRFCLNLE